MTKLEKRIERLEQQIPDRRLELPKEPRVAGKPREVAIAEHIEWLQEMSEHPAVNERHQELFLARAQRLLKIQADRLCDESS